MNNAVLDDVPSHVDMLDLARVARRAPQLQGVALLFSMHGTAWPHHPTRFRVRERFSHVLGACAVRVGVTLLWCACAALDYGDYGAPPK